MMTEKEFMGIYSSYTQKELLDLLYVEMQCNESLEEDIKKYESLQERNKSSREERIKYLNNLIPFLKTQRERTGKKRVLCAYAVVSALTFLAFCISGAVSDNEAILDFLFSSLLSGIFITALFEGLWSMTFQENIEDSHMIDKYEQELLFLETYHKLYF